MENKGNPYHDESGKFTSKEGQGSGASSQRMNQNTGNQVADYAASLWNDFLDRQEKSQKTNDEKVLNQMGLSKKDIEQPQSDDDDISFDNRIEVTYPDGSSDLVYIENLGDKLVEFLSEDKDADLSEEEIQYIRDNDRVLVRSNPFVMESDLKEAFTEWLKERYYPDILDHSWDKYDNYEGD